ncbi:MAG: STAS/SEC14 domain-containing protein [Anaerolineales bacterium]|nr:STAS/SEC14 domain-containing protein [Anaerolineales bacterium]
MIEILPESTENCIGFKISGEIDAEDYDTLLPKLDAAIAAHGKINLVVVLENMEGFDGIEAAKDDFHFGTHQYRHVEKAAFVSDKNWLEWSIKIMDPFTRRTEEKTFEPEQLSEAWAWILGDD